MAACGGVREEVRMREVCNVQGGEPRRASCEESPAGKRTLLLWSPGGARDAGRDVHRGGRREGQKYKRDGDREIIEIVIDMEG